MFRGVARSEVVVDHIDHIDHNEWIEAFVNSSNCHKLKPLTLHDCNLTDSDVLSISQSPHLSNLIYLELSNNHALTDASVMYLARSDCWGRLDTLDLANNPQLTPLIFHHLAQSPRLLASLNLIWALQCPLLGTEHRDIFSKAGWFDGQVLTD